MVNPNPMDLSCVSCGARSSTTSSLNRCEHCGNPLLNDETGELVADRDEPEMASALAHEGRNFCSKCGNKIKDAELFCNQCGNSLAPVAPTTIAATAKSPANLSGKGTLRRTITGKKRSVAWVYYGIFATVAFFMGFSSPVMFLAAIAFGAYSRYLFRGAASSFGSFDQGEVAGLQVLLLIRGRQMRDTAGDGIQAVEPVADDVNNARTSRGSY